MAKSEREKLEERLAKLAAERAESRVESLEIQRRLDEIAAAARVQARYDDMFAGLSDEDREALAQKLTAEGIPSGEEVGIPGN